MKHKAMYPYFYGDPGGSLNVNSFDKKFLMTAAFLVLPLVAVPVVSNATNADVILKRIEQALNELDGTAVVTRQISPIGGIACIVSGVCISQAKISLVKGNFPATAAFACGAAIALCGDRIAASQGL